MSRSRNIYTIPAGIPFADCLAKGILEQAGHDQEILSSFRILLPTRRACRALREQFLKLTAGKPLLLPAMNPIGDIDEDELSLKLVNAGGLDIPPAISPLRRQVMLAKLIESRLDFGRGTDQAMALAAELGKLIDQVIIAGLSLDKLTEIDVGDFAEHWQLTVKFLDIICENWPKILEENGMIEAADRRNRLILALSDLWQHNPPDNPVIAAGSTGTVPATSTLLKTVAGLEKGSVILPGLDSDIDPESWDAITDTHPQATLKKFLKDLDCAPKDVKSWPYAPKNVQPIRRTLLRELMRPAETVNRWTALEKKAIEPDLENLQRFDCETEQEEALLIAILLREALEEKGKTAALVTPDRALAQRVSQACKLWGISVDDSGGRTLNQSLRGSFMKLILTASLNNLQPQTLISLLKHSLCCVGYDFMAFRKKINHIEKYAIRDDVFYSDIFDLAEHKNLEKEHRALLEKLRDIFHPLLALRDAQHSFSTFLKTHLEVAESLAETAGSHGADRLWQEEDGEEAATLFSELGELAGLFHSLSLADYTNMIDMLMEGRPVRPAFGAHPRLMILGHLETRLIQADRMILASLNEKSWPPDVGHDPWMSRPMRKNYGLPAPEMRVGLAAHDFGQSFCAREVILTRSKRTDGAPTVPSRWLERLDTVLQCVDMNPGDLSKRDYKALVHALQKPDSEPKPYKRPAPTPDIAYRPKELSATQIETWMRDPYALYAYKILKLKKLNDLDTPVDARLKGDIIHKAFELFITQNKERLPDNARDSLYGILKEQIGPLAEDASFMSFWEPRLERITDWFITQETKWRQAASPTLSESKGSYTLPDTEFTITAKADRIDLMKDGSIAIIDYKTGLLPTQKDIKNGYAPQLPLEALILENNGFAPIQDRTVSHLSFWKVTGGKKAGEIKSLPTEKDSLSNLIHEYEEKLQFLIHEFNNRDVPYYSLPHAEHIPRYQDYAHLARVQEWAALEDAENTQEAA